jgi:prepilin-type N-terminal cleavage/methylation domain-containing protein
MVAKQSQRGFTIVELLIVIIVIGILAAITIVAYNGIQNRARVSSVSSALSQAAKKLAVYQVDNPDTYPADKTALDAIGIKDGGNVTYEYTRTSSTPNTYCLTATNGTTSYKISNTSTTPSPGGCAGHGVGGVPAISNLMPNPSFENTLTGWNNGMKTGDTATTSTTQAFSGTYSLALTAVSNTVDSYFEDHIALQPGTYTVSGYAYIPNNGPTFGNRDAMFYNVGGLSVSPGTVTYNRSLLNQWQRVSTTFTTTTAGTLGVRFYTPNGTSYFDGVMLTSGSSTYTYADGTSANWVWNGTAHNATSTGPPL